MSYSPSYSPGYSPRSPERYSPAYSPKSYQPSILQLARQGNSRAIAYWINSILGPQGVYLQAGSTRSGGMKIMVNFQRTKNPKVCIKAQANLVRHICYRLWTLNSAVIGDVRIMGRIAGSKDVLWRQTVRIRTPASKQRAAATVVRPGRKPVPRRGASGARSKPQRAGHKSFQLLRSLLFNRLALAGFIFCYWVLYLEATGHQVADQPTVAATAPAEQLKQTGGETKAQEKPAEAEKAAIAQTPVPQNPVFDVPSQFKGQVVSEASPPATAEKVIALTFDDGPWENTTEQILGILKQNNIKATFFMVGQAVQENPGIAKKVLAGGHVIGNHTWRHPMEDLDTTTAAQEMGNTAKLIYEATGAKTSLMRPPGGNLGGELANYAKQQGYMVTMWSADSSDYYVSTPLIIDNVLSNAKPGGIVLMHDGGGDRSQTVEALPQIISSLRRQGYKFVTLPEMMEMQSRWNQQTKPTPGASPLSSPSTLDPSGAVPQPNVPDSQLEPTHPQPNVPDSQLEPTHPQPSLPDAHLNQPDTPLGQPDTQLGQPDAPLGQPTTVETPTVSAPSPAYPPPPAVSPPASQPGLDTTKANLPLPPPPSLEVYETNPSPVSLPSNPVALPPPPALQPAG